MCVVTTVPGTKSQSEKDDGATPTVLDKPGGGSGVESCEDILGKEPDVAVRSQLSS